MIRTPLIAILLCLATSAACAPVSHGTDGGETNEGMGDRIIRGTGVGGIMIGDDADSVRSHWPIAGDTILLLEGDRQPALEIALDRDTIIAEIVDDRVWRIRVTSPGLATSDSIHVGTTASQLAEILGSPGATVLSGEGSYFVISPAHCGLSFGLEGLPFRARDWSLVELAAQPDSVRVDLILITGNC